MSEFHGVFEARVDEHLVSSIMLSIPSLAGETKVPCRHWVGAKPDVGSRGFIALLNGDPSWPVWLGSMS